MRASLIMKLVAVVSSSISSTSAPTSRASMMFAAWLVLPEASSVLKSSVALPAHQQPLPPCCRPPPSLWRRSPHVHPVRVAVQRD